ncbi:MAG: hypothetical protein ACQERB_11650 [Promethearchaeati archaeon]
MINEHFPEIEGDNLEKKHFILPQDLEGELNIVIIPFQRIQQSMVDEWTFELKPLYDQNEFLHLYEIPTLSSAYRLMSWMIDGGMRAGIPDKNVRNHTITLYVNKKEFKKALNIDTEDTIYILIVKKDGEILWRTKGHVNDEKIKQLKDELREFGEHFTFE